MENPVEEHSLGSRRLLQSGHCSDGGFWRSQEYQHSSDVLIRSQAQQFNSRRSQDFAKCLAKLGTSSREQLATSIHLEDLLAHQGVLFLDESPQFKRRSKKGAPTFPKLRMLPEGEGFSPPVRRLSGDVIVTGPWDQLQTLWATIAVV